MLLMNASQHDPMNLRPTRIPVDIPVEITSVLEAGEAHLRDLTEYGALIEGMTLPKGTQFQIEYQDQTVFGFVIWSEVDRFGARFPYTLHDGPLYARLEQARAIYEGRHQAFAPVPVASTPKRPFAGFGRRGID